MIRIPTAPAALAALALLICAPAASAATEEGDAGDLPATAQDLSEGVVTRIDGEFASTEDVDMYRVCVSGDGSFSASTVGGTPLDTQLFLFDANGRGVYANDDVQPGVGQSRLPDQHPLTPRTPGEYLLAVGPYNLDPQSAAEDDIFPAETGVVGPSPPGGAEPVAAWGNRASGSGPYSIFLTGTECAPPDTTPPVVELRSPADGVEVARNQPVEVDFSCRDEGGSGLASCVGTVRTGTLLDTSQLGPESVTVVARDNAGNETSVTHTVTVVEPQDSTAPTIKLLTPLDGAVYLLDQEVLADYSCADEEGGSGLLVCAGDAADGAPVDTGSVGAHEFGVHAADVAGNTADAGSAYRVIYDFDGFLRPVRNRPRVNDVQPGRTVPIRFELGGNQGLDVIADGWPQVAEVDCDFGDEPDSGVPARHPRWFRELAYRKRKRRYVFLWKTDPRWGGSCRQFMLKLKDGTVKRADFRFVRPRWDRDDDDDHHHSDDDSD